MKKVGINNAEMHNTIVYGHRTTRTVSANTSGYRSDAVSRNLPSALLNKVQAS